MDFEDFTQLMENMWDGFTEEEDLKSSQRKQQIPVKKARFLAAIGKGTVPVIDDEQPHDEDISSLFHQLRYTTNMYWKDSVVTNVFNTWKQPIFDISSYIDCVKYVYSAYFGLITVDKDIVLKSMVYIIAHARDFTNPENCLLKFNEEGSINELAAPNLPEITELPDTPYTTAIKKCLTHLSDHSTDTDAYYQLNANITYLILLLMRRSVKSEDEYLKSFNKAVTHHNYIKLCRHPFHKTLPVVSYQLNKELYHMLKGSKMIFLVLTALQQCGEEKTKNILKITCLNHLKWTGLAFPKMFFLVAKLYKVSEAELWDHLCTDTTFDSLIQLSDAYYRQYSDTIEDPSASYNLFPYARAVSVDYDTDLAPRNHVNICYTLAYLCDLHFGLDKSHARNAHWAKSCRGADELAMKIYKEIKDKHKNMCNSTPSEIDTA